jgi:hypothetical protein
VILYTVILCLISQSKLYLLFGQFICNFCGNEINVSIKIELPYYKVINDNGMCSLVGLHVDILREISKIK